MSAPRLLTLAQVGERIGASYWSAYRMVRAHNLRTVKVRGVIQVREEDLARLIESRTFPARRSA